MSIVRIPPDKSDLEECENIYNRIFKIKSDYRIFALKELLSRKAFKKIDAYENSFSRAVFRAKERGYVDTMKCLEREAKNYRKFYKFFWHTMEEGTKLTDKKSLISLITGFESFKGKLSDGFMDYEE